MLRLSKKADYGLIALTHLAARSESASAKEIATAYRLPRPLLAKILQKLQRAGFVRSVHGANGGYTLAREATAISALEVIRAIDGPVIFTSCYTHDGRCHQSKKCTIREPLLTVHEGIVGLLAGIKISDMLRPKKSTEPLTVLHTCMRDPS